MQERETSDAMPLSKSKLHVRLPTYPRRADINTLEYGPIRFTGPFSSLPFETPILTPSTPGATASRGSKQTQWIGLQRLLLLCFPLHSCTNARIRPFRGRGSVATALPLGRSTAA